MTTATRPGGRPPIPAEAFDHGDARRYARGCRCRACTTAATARDRQCAYLRETGRGLLRDTTRAAEHLARLRDAGMSDAAIGAAARITGPHLRDIITRQKRIHIDTERRILAVPIPPPGPSESHVRVAADGTVRRLRALVADGWPTSELARRLGLHLPYLRFLLRRPAAVEHRTAVAVRDLHAAFAGLRPEKRGADPGAAERARRYATRKGWADSVWWEDYGGIDDPAAPETEPETPEQPRWVLLAEEALWLESQGYTRRQAGDRLGVTKDYVDQAIRRLGQRQQTEEAA